MLIVRFKTVVHFRYLKSGFESSRNHEHEISGKQLFLKIQAVHLKSQIQ